MWLAEGLLFYLKPAAVHRLLDEITSLSAPGSESLTDTIGQSLLDGPHMRQWCDWLAEQGTPWLFGTDQPENDLFEPRGWRATVSLYTDVGSRLGRWPHPALPRDAPAYHEAFSSTPPLTGREDDHPRLVASRGSDGQVATI